MIANVRTQSPCTVNLAPVHSGAAEMYTNTLEEVLVIA